MRTEIITNGHYKQVIYRNYSNILNKIEVFNNDELEAITTFYNDGKNAKTITTYMSGKRYFTEFNEAGEVVLRKTETLKK